ncbi:hypothetical protein KCH_29300 [Kitasatospora cheerisanensis KCTC 2395]|uniref:Uncharacterized protein n=1 Tax=Kitasatospora cheerisanensis KCTC 2395 TaxID=1348663 RepID=A0A066YZD2_9ACTN|nr:hypothetical protein KCH_29300 [Kitasatospora cheerisanensis KCTC 2395]
MQPPGVHPPLVLDGRLRQPREGPAPLRPAEERLSPARRGRPSADTA